MKGKVNAVVMYEISEDLLQDKILFKKIIWDGL